MKLRIRGDSLRLRLGQAEVTTLAEKGIVEETTSFGSSELAYAIAFGPALGATFVGTRIVITIPADVARVWASGDSVGVEATQKGSGDRVLRILIEKDWACVRPRDDEDELDTYPHP